MQREFYTTREPLVVFEDFPGQLNIRPFQGRNDVHKHLLYDLFEFGDFLVQLPAVESLGRARRQFDDVLRQIANTLDVDDDGREDQPQVDIGLR
ncbi:MAG: hypothetical protein HKO65_17900 [Gemmatimonadetes bacterium]|nr:hypothetical protein [Gemmatimonadota bacterium]